MPVREVKKIVAGTPTKDGAGVHLTRVLGHRDTADFDPFLMLDAFDSINPDDYTKGFPWHPHRGIETITYLIKGRVEHGDSLGNQGVIGDGDCQWMTAGSGIIHQEMPKEAPRMLGAQLWLNLPAREKMTDPAYGDITKDQIPLIDRGNARVRILSGAFGGVAGAFQGRHIKATYLDIELDPGAVWDMKTNPKDTVFCYLFYGSARFGKKGTVVEEKRAALFYPGDSLTAVAGASGTRMICLSAKPLGEPVAWGGPIVMNTREELDLAFRELDEGTFIKHGKPGHQEG